VDVTAGGEVRPLPSVEIHFATLWEVDFFPMWKIVTQCFAFFSGGFSLDIGFAGGAYSEADYNAQGIFQIIVSRGVALTNDGSYSNAPFSNFSSGGPSLMEMVPNNTNKRIQVTVPGTNIVPFMPCLALANDTFGHPASVMAGGFYYNLEDVDGADHSPRFFVGFNYTFSDDFSLFWKVGPPTMNLNTAGVTPIYPYASWTWS